MPKMARVFICILCHACSSGPSEQEITALAELRCEATRLKDERFALADSIRLLEEKSPVESKTDIEKMNQRGQHLKMQSLALADSIQSRLNYFFTEKFTTREKRNRFLEQVDKKMLEMNCR